MQKFCSSYPLIVNGKNQYNTNQTPNTTNEEEIERTYFFPTLHVQRLSSVANIVEQFDDVTRVLDLGCGEGKLVQFLKQVRNITEIRGVDLDESEVNFACSRGAPLVSDHLLPRANPLKVSFCHGDILLSDKLLLDFDCVVCIEVVEHIKEEDVKAMVKNVFGFISPKVAIFTTPNYEFNAILDRSSNHHRQRDNNDMSSITPKFRHYDHKFEFTRKQFREWCESIVEEYGYDVDYCGVGDAPAGEQLDVGYCTQIAVFTSRGDKVKREVISGEPKCDQQISCDSYVVVGEFNYPFKKVVPVTEDQVTLELEKNYRFYCKVNGMELDEFVEMKDLLKSPNPVLSSFVGGDIEKAFYYLLLSKGNFIRSDDGVMVRGSDDYNRKSSYYGDEDEEEEEEEDEYENDE